MQSQAEFRSAIAIDPAGDDSLFAARLRLAHSPSPEIVDSFFLTRAAAQALSKLNQFSSIRPGIFWISNPAGAGKTHFLNYLIAMEGGAGAREGASGRHLTVAVGEDEAAAGLLRACLRQLVDQLSVSDRHKALWSKMGEADGWRTALDQAKRQGFRSTILLLDFGDADEAAIERFGRELGKIIELRCGPIMSIIAAARSAPSDRSDEHLAVAAEPDEEIEVALRRACSAINEREHRRKPRSRPLEPKMSDPLAASTAALMRAIAPENRRIPALAQLAYEALLARDQVSKEIQITPDELAECPSIRRLCAERLGELGERAIAGALKAVATLRPERRERARLIIEYLKLARLAGTNRWVAVDELSAAAAPQVNSRESLALILEELARYTGGVVHISADGASVRLNIESAETPEIAMFNQALAEVRAFAPGLGPVMSRAELAVANEQLRTALTDAIEQASRAGERMVQLARRCGVALTPEQTSALTSYIALAARGPLAIIDSRADKKELAQTIVEYRHVAALAAAAPRLEAMRDYLLGLGLQIHDDPSIDPVAAKLEAECKLLLVDVEAAVNARSSGVLEPLESRFERFKWTYAPFYKKAHERWIEEMRELASVVAQGARHLSALQRLVRISSLSAALDPALEEEFFTIAARVPTCEMADGIAPELEPRCPSCGFVMGTPGPRRALLEVTGRIRQQVEATLVRLSQLVISRLIREHRGDDRLSGFFKIIQAAQADALIEVLDDTLTDYLSALLDEERATSTSPAWAPSAQSGPTPPDSAKRARRRSSHSRPA